MFGLEKRISDLRPITRLHCLSQPKIYLSVTGCVPMMRMIPSWGDLGRAGTDCRTLGRLRQKNVFNCCNRRDGGYNVVVFEVKKEIPAQSRSDRTAVRAEQCSREQDPVQPLTTTYRKSVLRLPCAKAEDRCPDHRELQPDSVYRDLPWNRRSGH